MMPHWIPAWMAFRVYHHCPIRCKKDSYTQAISFLPLFLPLFCRIYRIRIQFRVFLSPFTQVSMRKMTSNPSKFYSINFNQSPFGPRFLLSVTRRPQLPRFLSYTLLFSKLCHPAPNLFPCPSDYAILRVKHAFYLSNLSAGVKLIKQLFPYSSSPIWLPSDRKGLGRQ